MVQKRGGAAPMLSLDWAAAEERFDLEPATQASPDKLFEKQWALTILGDVLTRLGREYQSEAKRICLPPSGKPSLDCGNPNPMPNWR